MTRLDEFDKEEWFGVAAYLMPGLKRDEYELMWQRYLEAKAEHERSLQLH